MPAEASSLPKFPCGPERVLIVGLHIQSNIPHRVRVEVRSASGLPPAVERMHFAGLMPRDVADVLLARSLKLELVQTWHVQLQRGPRSTSATSRSIRPAK